MFRIKICGITSPADAQMAAAAGADAIGINFYAGSKRFVEPDLAKNIAAAVPESISRVGVFVNAKAGEILVAARDVPLDYIQLHGDEPPELVAALSPLQVIKAFRCQDGGFADVAHFLSKCGQGSLPSSVLVDAYHPTEYGGTGERLDWKDVSRQMGVLGEIPLILAGGLTAENVVEAIEIAQPYAVDTASGVESSPGVKDAAKVRAFVENAKRAFAY